VELTKSLKAFYKATADSLRGAARRAFIAGVVKELGYGGQTRAMNELGWCDATIRKGLRELAHNWGCCCGERRALRSTTWVWLRAT